MGGRGSISFSTVEELTRGNVLFQRTPSARLNRGIAGGASEEEAVSKFRNFSKDKDFIYSGYIDSQGYVHGLGTSYNAFAVGQVKIEDIKTANFPKTSIYNAPAGDYGFGGGFSFGSLVSARKNFVGSNGKSNTTIISSPEGNYKAVFKGRPKNAPKAGQLKKAYERANAITGERKYHSHRGMWEAFNKNLSEEMKKYKIEVSFERDKSFKPRKTR